MGAALGKEDANVFLVVSTSVNVLDRDALTRVKQIAIWSRQMADVLITPASFLPTGLATLFAPKARMNPSSKEDAAKEEETDASIAMWSVKRLGSGESAFFVDEGPSVLHSGAAALQKWTRMYKVPLVASIVPGTARDMFADRRLVGIALVDGTLPSDVRATLRQQARSLIAAGIKPSDAYIAWIDRQRFRTYVHRVLLGGNDALAATLPSAMLLNPIDEIMWLKTADNGDEPLTASALATTLRSAIDGSLKGEQMGGFFRRSSVAFNRTTESLGVFTSFSLLHLFSCVR